MQYTMFLLSSLPFLGGQIIMASVLFQINFVTALTILSGGTSVTGKPDSVNQPLLPLQLQPRDLHVAEEDVKQVIGKSVIDYSAASEYVEVHYGIPSYFGNPTIREETIFDARHGVLFNNRNGRNQQLQPSKLDLSGFELFSSPTNVKNFTDMKQISSIYLQELRKFIPKVLLDTRDDDDPSKLNANSIIDSIVFWHPMLRGEDTDIQPRSSNHPSTAGIASMVHMDTDVGAYGLDGILNLVKNNRIVEDEAEEGQPNDYWTNLHKSLLQERKRLILLNIWRPIEHPVLSAPLGIWSIEYSENSHSGWFFPEAIPNLELSRWYVYSNMQTDEVLLFKQYDRDLNYPSDLWHCAIKLEEEGAQSYSPRKSFDVKAMVILNEQVQPEFDRLLVTSCNTTTQPVLLTLEQSGEFCNMQGRRLKRRRNNQ